MLLAGKVALVSGAASGIGLAVAEAYAREGAAVVLSDIDADAGQAVAARLAGGGANVRPYVAVATGEIRLVPGG